VRLHPEHGVQIWSQTRDIGALEIVQGRFTGLIAGMKEFVLWGKVEQIESGLNGIWKTER